MTASDLKTSMTRVGPVEVCTFTGYMITDSEDLGAGTLRKALGERPGVLAVDLAGVQLFTSSALNLLLTARGTAADQGVPLVLVNPSSAVRRVLFGTGAAPLFPTFPTAEDAARAHARTDGHGDPGSCP